MPVIAVIRAESSGLIMGAGGLEAMGILIEGGKDWACGILLSGDRVLAQDGIGVGLGVSSITIGVGGLGWIMGVVGVESMLVSISDVGSMLSASGGGGVVKLRTLIFFFFVFLGLHMLRGISLVALGVQAMRLRVWVSSLSLADWRVVLTLFFNWVILLANFSSSSFLIASNLVSACC